jgi:hypothetical protein
MNDKELRIENNGEFMHMVHYSKYVFQKLGPLNKIAQ